jgi:hypothetical protein
MTDADLAMVLPGLCFVCGNQELLLRSLAQGPDLREVIEDLMRAAYLYTVILEAWPQDAPGGP